MRKRQISLTFETGLLATIAIALSLWTLLRLIGVATFAGAGCQQHGMHIDLAHIKEYCKVIKLTGYSGFANLLALATAAAGIYGAVQCFRCRANGIITLILLFGLQTPDIRRFFMQADALTGRYRRALRGSRRHRGCRY